MNTPSYVAVRPSILGGKTWMTEVITDEGTIYFDSGSYKQVQCEYDCFEAAKIGSSHFCELYGIPRKIYHTKDVAVKFQRFGYNFMHLNNKMYLVWPHINGSPIAEFRDSYWYVNGEKIDTTPVYFAELPTGPAP